MQNIKFLFIILLLSGLFACKNEPKKIAAPEVEAKKKVIENRVAPDNETKIEAISELEKIETPILKMDANNIITQNGQKIDWRPAGVTTFIVLRHGERQKDKKLLNQNGKMRAARLANMMKGVPVKTVSFSNNMEMYMGHHVKTASGAELIGYDPAQPATALNDLKNKYAGQINLIIGNRETSTDFVNRLAGKTIVKPVSEDYYDKVYICHIANNQLVSGFDMDLYKLF